MPASGELMDSVSLAFLERNLWTFSKLHICHPGFWVSIQSPSFHSLYSDRRTGRSGFREGGGQCLDDLQLEYLWCKILPLSLYSSEWSRSQELDWQLRCRQKQETPRMEILSTYSIFIPPIPSRWVTERLLTWSMLNMLKCMKTVQPPCFNLWTRSFIKLNFAKSLFPMQNITLSICVTS